MGKLHNLENPLRKICGYTTFLFLFKHFTKETQPWASGSKVCSDASVTAAFVSSRSFALASPSEEMQRLWAKVAYCAERLPFVVFPSSSSELFIGKRWGTWRALMALCLVIWQQCGVALCVPLFKWGRKRRPYQGHNLCLENNCEYYKPMLSSLVQFVELTNQRAGNSWSDWSV